MNGGYRNQQSKNSQKTKALDQIASQVNFNKHSEKNQPLYFSNSSKKFKRREDT